MPTLETTVNGLKLPNPFVIGSGPPGTNGNVIGKAFDEGWGAVVCKTISLDADKVVNVQPRYGRLRSRYSDEILGWENIELISDRSFEVWTDEFKQVKDKYPEGVLIASIMEEYDRDAWRKIIERCQDVEVDAFELNMSCPHGLPERRMGSAMGENPDILEEVCGWAMEVAQKPVWVKLTPNVTRIEDSARASLRAGCQGLSAINTIRSVIGVNLRYAASRTVDRRLYHARRLFLPGGVADCLADVHGSCRGHPRRVSRLYPQWYWRNRNGQRCCAIYFARCRYRSSLYRSDEVWLSHDQGDAGRVAGLYGATQVRTAGRLQRPQRAVLHDPRRPGKTAGGSPRREKSGAKKDDYCRPPVGW